MSVLTLAAREVKVGDELFHPGTASPWHRVLAVSEVTRNQVEREDRVTVIRKSRSSVIVTVSWTTYKHPEEGVTVRREETV